MFLVSARLNFPSFPLTLSLSKFLLCTRARSFTLCIFGACSSLLRRIGSASPPRQRNSSNVPCCGFLGTELVSVYFSLTKKMSLALAHPWSRYIPPSTRIQLHVSFLCSFVSPNIFFGVTFSFSLFQFNHVVLVMREKLA